VVIAPKLDRLIRSALDALKVIESLNDPGVKLSNRRLNKWVSRVALSRHCLWPCAKARVLG